MYMYIYIYICVSNNKYYLNKFGKVLKYTDFFIFDIIAYLLGKTQINLCI
jgi:hypothetical protein